MKLDTWKFLFLIFFVCPLALVKGQELAITGVFQGKPLFVQNPLAENSNQFCIREILINGRPQQLNLRLSAIEVNFKGVDMYTPVAVRVLHDSICTPRIVNPEAIFWHSSFRFDSVQFAGEELKWATRGERESAFYLLEKLNVDEWIQVQELVSQGKFASSKYSVFPELSEGSNKFRIKYEAGPGNYLYSDEVEIVFYKEPITFSPKVVTDRMTLSRAVAFEILNEKEEVILTGNAKEIPLRLLKPGTYYIVLEGYKEVFVKK